MTGLVHGASAYANRKCGCDHCRAEFAAYHRRRRQRLRGKPLPPQVAHGSLNACTNYGCRCDQCRGANASNWRAWYARRSAS